MVGSHERLGGCHGYLARGGVAAVDFRIATDLEQALSWKADHAADARLIAGGTDLVLRLPRLAQRPKMLIQLPPCREPAKRWKGKGLCRDESSIREASEPMNYFVTGPNIRIPALACLSALAQDPLLRSTLPLVPEALAHIGSPQIRNAATLAGNLANASPACDSAPALMVYGAQVEIQSVRGCRLVPLSDFFLGPGATVIADDEVLTAVEVPEPESREDCAEYHRFSKFGPRGSNVIASANIAMRLVVQQGTVEGEARVVLCRVCAGSVAPVPQRLTGVEGLLEATSPALLASDQVLLALRQLLDAEIRPISDVRGSDWYKRRVVELALVEFLESVAGHYGQEV